MYDRAPHSTAVAVFILLVFSAAGTSAIEPRPSVPIATSAQEEAVLEALTESTIFDFDETPLDEAVDFILNLHGIGVAVDQHRLDKIGVGETAPVTIRVKGVTLHSALKLMLRTIDPRLTYAVRDEVLLITTIESARDNPVTRVYNVRRLLRVGETAENLATIVGKTLVAQLAKASKQEAKRASSSDKKKEAAAKPGALGATNKDVQRIAWYQDQLIVRATEDGHHEVQLILEAIAAGLESRVRTSRAERQQWVISAALARRVSLLEHRLSLLQSRLDREKR